MQKPRKGFLGYAIIFCVIFYFINWSFFVYSTKKHEPDSNISTNPEFLFIDNIEEQYIEFVFTDGKIDILYHNCTPTEGVKILVDHFKKEIENQCNAKSIKR